MQFFQSGKGQVPGDKIDVLAQVQRHSNVNAATLSIEGEIGQIKWAIEMVLVLSE